MRSLRGMPKPMKADLHTHSTASDGELAPAELVQRAARQGLTLLALTDHDTAAGLAEAQETARRFGLSFIGGVEISTDVPTGELHILGYGIDPDCGQLAAALKQFRRASIRRLALMLERLRLLGVDLNEASIVPRGNEHSVGRPHVARALVAGGHVGTISEAFELFLAEGRPAYVRKERARPADVIGLIRRAGGLPVLAHPLGVHDLDLLLPVLIAAGLAGLECYYAEYDVEQRQLLAQLADDHGLLVTGGSDFHGDRMHQLRAFGSVDIPQKRLMQFLDSFEQRVRWSTHDCR